MSKRTDGGPAQKLRNLPNAGYGDNAEYENLQQSAPLAQTPSSSAGMSLGGGGAASTPPIGFDAPSQYPDQPVTAGADSGAGPGSEALGLPGTPQMDPQDQERLRSYLPAMIAQAARPEATQSFRNYVRALRSQVM
jgi:hypothetical protein